MLQYLPCKLRKAIQIMAKITLFWLWLLKSTEQTFLEKGSVHYWIMMLIENHFLTATFPFLQGKYCSHLIFTTMCSTLTDCNRFCPWSSSMDAVVTGWVLCLTHMAWSGSISDSSRHLEQNYLYIIRHYVKSPINLLTPLFHKFQTLQCSDPCSPGYHSMTCCKSWSKIPSLFYF